MNPKNYTSLTTSKRLKELGIVQRSDMCHQKFTSSDGEISYGFALVNMVDGVSRERYSAFNASELIAMLDGYTCFIENDYGMVYDCINLNESKGSEWCAPLNLPDKLAELLIQNIGVEYSVDEVNERYTKYLEQ